MSSVLPWSTYPWMAVLPPNRPDEENLRLMSLSVQRLERRDHAVVLGSTPEYRRLLSRQFNTVTVVDSSVEFYDSVSFMAGGLASNERMIHADWLDVLPSDVAAADFIASHFTHGNVPFEHRPDFFRAIAATLAPGGYFFDTIFQPGDTLVTIARLDESYGDAPLNLRVLNDLSCDAIFLGEYLREHNVVDSDAAAAWVNGATKSEWVAYLIQHVLQYITPRNSRWDYAPALTPHVLGYDHWLHTVTSARPETRSVFQNVVTVQLSSSKERIDA